MVYPLPSHQRAPPPSYDWRHPIHPYQSPAHAHGFVYPEPHLINYDQPQNIGGWMFCGIPSALVHFSYPMQHQLAPGEPVHGHYPSSVRSGSMQQREPDQAPVYGFTGYNLPPGYYSRDSNSVDKPSSGTELGAAKTIVDGSRPTKLKQTGSNYSKAPCPAKPARYALWAGNIPRTASLTELKDHFSQLATEDIESVFLIPRSNCAIVNYRSSASCAAALSRFDGLDFQGTRLICRPKRETSVQRPGIKYPTSFPFSLDETGSITRNEGSQCPSRYFIIKSLTKEGLLLSQQSGIWVTQIHNEPKLNQAFESSRQVYLVFSANKSGEYFGYARMLSPINYYDEVSSMVLPRLKPRDRYRGVINVIPTCATSTAPNGRITCGLAQNAMLWEAEPTSGNMGVGERETEARPFGRPFRIQWMSHRRVPFHRTHGLRNPWNSNRNVKVARDGTEVEPTVGRKLIQLFHQM